MNDLSLWWNAARKAVEGENPECPRCNARRLDFQYVGDWSRPVEIEEEAASETRK
jgi:hypothetical protein